VKYLTFGIKYITPAIKDSYSFVREIWAPTSHLPEGRCQPCPPEYLLSLFGCPSVIIWRQAVVVPKPGKLPDLIEWKNFSTRELVSFAPALDPFLRPEEEHGRSGEGQIIIPAGERQREVDK
jgi:hypothetical protein